MDTQSLLISVAVLTILHSASAVLPSAHPRNYHAPRVATPVEIDGDIYKKVWADVPWSEDFVDIQGDDAPKENRPTVDTRTRMKMMWDDNYLYIAAEMSARNWPILAEFTKRNEPIYQKDSDIEVFIDADGSNANYKEFEVNALNTVWNLLLNRPYSSGGAEHSGRVSKPGEKMYWDVNGQHTSSKMFGEIGKKNWDGKWTSEMKFSHTDTLDRTGGVKPAVGKFWRIGFSRVEKKGDLNWVWSPQMIWTPAKGAYTGQVNMHAPDAWGYVVFSDAAGPAGTQKDWVDPNWNIKAAAHQLFYAEKYASTPEGGGKMLSPAQLQQKNWVSADSFQGLTADVTKAADGSWIANIEDGNGCISTIHHDNLHSYQCQTMFFGMVIPPRSVFFGLGSLAILGAAGTYLVVRNKSKPSGVTD